MPTDKKYVSAEQHKIFGCLGILAILALIGVGSVVAFIIYLLTE